MSTTFNFGFGANLFSNGFKFQIRPLSYYNGFRYDGMQNPIIPYLPAGQITNEGMVNSWYSNWFPMQYTRYGGDWQVSHLTPPPELDNNIYFNALGAQMMGTSFIGSNMNMQPQAIDQSAISQSVSADADKAASSIITNKVNIVANTAKSLKTKVSSELAKEDIQDDKKSTLEGLKAEIEEIEQEIETLKKSGRDDSATKIENKDANKKCNELKDKLKEINDKLTKALKKEETPASEDNTETGTETETETEN